MGERISARRQNTGMDRSALSLFGMILLGLGVMSKGILQARVLQMNTATQSQLAEILDLSGAMTVAAVAIALEAISSCAVPIFAVLLIDGFEKTKNYRDYLLRVAAVAAISEIPYNFAMSATIWDTSSRNPAFASVICLLALFLYRNYSETTWKNALICAVVFAAAVIWVVMLRVQYGVILLIVVSVLWMLRKHRAIRNYAGAAAAICCCAGNPLYMFSPFGFLLAHFYNGNEGNTNRIMRYLLYPIMLVLIGIAGALLF